MKYGDRVSYLFLQPNDTTIHECIRTQPWDIICRVIKQEGHCAVGHEVGDEVKGKL